MKNNRGTINASDVSKIVGTIGDPDLMPQDLDLGTEGTRSIILLDLGDPGDIEIYDDINNNAEDYELLDEVEHHGRYTVFVTLRFIRKTPWPPEGRPVSSLHLVTSSRKSPRGKKKTPRKKKEGKIGFTPKSSR